MLRDVLDLDYIADDGASEELPHDMRAASEDHSDSAALMREELHRVTWRLMEMETRLRELEGE